MLLYLPSAISSLFRVCSYIFLQIIPTRLAQPVLPLLYILHLLTSWLCAPQTNGPVPLKDKDKSNGHALAPRSQTHPNLLLAVLFSLPTTYRCLAYIISINTLLLLAAADFALAPFFDDASGVTFTRIGAVFPDSVKIMVRYPQANATQHTLLVLYREKNSTPSVNGAPWKDGPWIHLKEDLDWVDTISLDNLWPETTYEYTLSNLNRTLLPYPLQPIVFQTFPDPHLNTGSHFRFIVTSCITPNFPYKGPFHRRTIHGFDLLASYLHRLALSPSNAHSTFGDTRSPGATVSNISTPAMSQIESTKPTHQAVISTEFLLFLGDFIYADVPLYIGDDQEAYQRLYRRNYNSPSFRRIYEKLPILHAYDDHEFLNNYAGQGIDVAPYVNAARAFGMYAGNANYDPIKPGQHYYSFKHGDVAFFVMDTRRHRSSSDVDPVDRTMLGEAQLSALYTWLHQVNETCTFKFVVSSVPFTSLWTHDAQVDSWAGFPTEKMTLLSTFHTVPNIIILSGDRHEFAAIQFNSPNPAHHLVREFSTSPLNMFYMPIIRTLRRRSEESFTKDDEDIEEIPYEQTIAYLPVGNSKWSSLEIDAKNQQSPVLRLEVIIEGQPVYNLRITGVRTQVANLSSLGSLVATNMKDLLDKIGLKPGRWF